MGVQHGRCVPASGSFSRSARSRPGVPRCGQPSCGRTLKNLSSMRRRSRSAHGWGPLLPLDDRSGGHPGHPSARVDKWRHSAGAGLRPGSARLRRPARTHRADGQHLHHGRPAVRLPLQGPGGERDRGRVFRDGDAGRRLGQRAVRRSGRAPGPDHVRADTRRGGTPHLLRSASRGSARDRRGTADRRRLSFRCSAKHPVRGYFPRRPGGPLGEPGISAAGARYPSCRPRPGPRCEQGHRESRQLLALIPGRYDAGILPADSQRPVWRVADAPLSRRDEPDSLSPGGDHQPGPGCAEHLALQRSAECLRDLPVR